MLKVVLVVPLLFQAKTAGMKKIIAAFDGLKYSESTKEYAIQMTRLTNSRLVGVFMDDPTYSSYKIYELVTRNGVSESKLKKLDAQDKATRNAAAKKFITDCSEAAVDFGVHHDHNVAIHELKHESIYADLLIIDSAETLTHYTEKLPTRFIRDLLSDAQCPVLVVPQRYNAIKKVVLLYDGEPSSVHAIKMFSYLLPQLNELETEIIFVNPVNSILHMPDKALMQEFMTSHYPGAKYTLMKGRAENEIIRYLKPINKNTLVVLGAYRRGTVSRWFRESMADTLMKELKLPMFIAHAR